MIELINTGEYKWTFKYPEEDNEGLKFLKKLLQDIHELQLKLINENPEKVHLLKDAIKYCCPIPPLLEIDHEDGGLIRYNSLLLMKRLMEGEKVEPVTEVECLAVALLMVKTIVQETEDGFNIKEGAFPKDSPIADEAAIAIMGFTILMLAEKLPPEVRAILPQKLFPHQERFLKELETINQIPEAEKAIQNCLTGIKRSIEAVFFAKGRDKTASEVPTNIKEILTTSGT